MTLANEVCSKTSRYKPELFFFDLCFAFELSPLIFGRSNTRTTFKERGKTRKAVEPDRKARFRHQHALLQQFLRPLDAHVRQVLMSNDPDDLQEVSLSRHWLRRLRLRLSGPIS